MAKTNEQKLRSLIKNQHTILNALLVERLLKIADMTEEAYTRDPDAFNNPFVTVESYKTLVANIRRELSEQGEMFARKCSVTGQGMNSGWVAYDGEYHFKYESDAEAWCVERGYSDLQEAYDANVIYYTEWEEDYEWQMVNGVLTEIE